MLHSAKCCGRKVSDDMMLDTSSLSESRKKELGIQDELCDGCRERLFRTVDRYDFYRELGLA